MASRKSRITAQAGGFICQRPFGASSRKASIVRFGERHFLDHAAIRQNRLNADDVIDSKSLERALCEKPASAFSQRASLALDPTVRRGSSPDRARACAPWDRGCGRRRG
ncbi:MAG: hypothetical protein FJX48_12785 [Alphaproteobacteria bacterium]|nr:hypothetical protein [Alphaproteobacteria bacterium]